MVESEKVGLNINKSKIKLMVKDQTDKLENIDIIQGR